MGIELHKRTKVTQPGFSRNAQFPCLAQKVPKIERKEDFLTFEKLGDDDDDDDDDDNDNDLFLKNDCATKGV